MISAVRLGPALLSGSNVKDKQLRVCTSQTRTDGRKQTGDFHTILSAPSRVILESNGFHLTEELSNNHHKAE